MLILPVEFTQKQSGGDRIPLGEDSLSPNSPGIWVRTISSLQTSQVNNCSGRVRWVSSSRFERGFRENLMAWPVLTVSMTYGLSSLALHHTASRDTAAICPLFAPLEWSECAICHSAVDKRESERTLPSFASVSSSCLSND